MMSRCPNTWVFLEFWNLNLGSHTCRVSAFLSDPSFGPVIEMEVLICCKDTSVSQAEVTIDAYLCAQPPTDKY